MRKTIPLPVAVTAVLITVVAILIASGAVSLHAQARPLSG